MVPIVRNGALAGPFELQHDCFWFRPPYPWHKGSLAKPHEVMDHYCMVHYWHPMVSDAGRQRPCGYQLSGITQKWLYICRHSSMGFQECQTKYAALAASSVMEFKVQVS